MSEESVFSEDGDADESMDMDAEAAEEMNANKDTVNFEGFEEDEEDEEWEERYAAGVYEKTIGELGDVLGGPPIGIITDDSSVMVAEQQKHDLSFVESEDEMEL